MRVPVTLAAALAAPDATHWSIGSVAGWIEPIA
jgi:hypothetical protein